jgi:hypothetical protein
VSLSLINFVSPKIFTVLGMFWNVFLSPSFFREQSACRKLVPKCIPDKRTTYFPAIPVATTREEIIKPLMKWVY